jgi:signal transduction histidine kinase
MALKADGIRTMVAAVAASVSVVVIAVLFANGTTASRVADNAGNLHWANSTLGTAALARAAAGQLTLVTDPATSGFSASADEDAAAELVETTRALEKLVGAAPANLRSRLDALVEALDARPVDLPAVENRYVVVRSSLKSEMDRLELAITESDEAAGRLSAVLRLLVTLVLPVIAILFYRRRAARQVREAEVRMAAQLEAEREVSRAKDQFVAGMSHELRTPLTGIHGFAEVLLEAPPDAAADRDLVREIHTQSAELGRMVDDFIVASRIQGTGVDVRIAPVDVVGEAGAVAAQFQRHDTEISVAGNAPPASADRGRLRHILINLMSNAVTHGGATIRVELASEGPTVRCAVVDDGPGVDPEMEDRLFTKFVHVGNDVVVQGSLGLGTWVARTLAEAMNGELVYRRTANETIFELTLPSLPIEDVATGAEVEMAAR